MTSKPSTPEAVRLFHDGTLALSRMEHNGIRVDTALLDRTIDEVGGQITTLEKRLREDAFFHKWRRHHGESTNLGSRQQLANMLFKVERFPCTSKTETGRDKADADAIRATGLPFALDYLRLEKLKKMKGTYLKGIRDEVCGGFLHPSFNLHLARSMRSSCNGPNLQNVPVRNPEVGKAVRSCFVPRPGWQLAEVDYSGIEVKIAAAYHKDPAMVRYIKDPSTDMHRDTAAECFMVPPGEVDKKARYVAKNQFVFPQFYGSFYVDCARAMWNSTEQMELTHNGKPMREHLKSKGIHALGACDPKQRPRAGTFEAHVQRVERDFWERRFPVYAAWKRSWWDAYRREGGFTNLTGFRINGVYRRNEVINYPVQSSAFHCLLWSLIEVQRELDARGMRTLLVCQIHDSLLADVPPDELDEYLRLAKEVMTKRLPERWRWVNVPLDVEAEVSPVDESWFNKKAVPVP